MKNEALFEMLSAPEMDKIGSWRVCNQFAGIKSPHRGLSFG